MNQDQLFEIKESFGACSVTLPNDLINDIFKRSDLFSNKCQIGIEVVPRDRSSSFIVFHRNPVQSSGKKHIGLSQSMIKQFDLPEKLKGPRNKLIRTFVRVLSVPPMINSGELPGIELTPLFNIEKTCKELNIVKINEKEIETALQTSLNQHNIIAANQCILLHAPSIGVPLPYLVQKVFREWNNKKRKICGAVCLPIDDFRAIIKINDIDLWAEKRSATEAFRDIYHF